MASADEIQENEPRSREDIDLEKLYRDIGEFVVLFQIVENQLWQLGVLALGHDDFDGSRRRLVGLSFRGLADAARTAVFNRLDRQNRAAPEYRSRIDAVLERCDALRLYRNRLVHSTFVFLEGGGELRGIVRSDMGKDSASDGVVLDQEAVTTTTFDEVRAELAAVGFELSLCRTQLAFWS